MSRGLTIHGLVSFMNPESTLGSRAFVDMFEDLVRRITIQRMFLHCPRSAARDLDWTPSLDGLVDSTSRPGIGLSSCHMSDLKTATLQDPTSVLPQLRSAFSFGLQTERHHTAANKARGTDGDPLLRRLLLPLLHHVRGARVARVVHRPVAVDTRT